MRTSHAQFFESSSANFALNQARLQRVVDQISSGKRMLTASDDPVASTHVLLSERAKAMNTQYQRNAEFARDQLTQGESALGDVTSTLQSARELLLSAGNSSLSNADRRTIARELRGQMEHMLGLANSRDGSGNYLFAGYRDDAQPFVPTRDANGDITTVGYVGTQDAVQYEVSDTRDMSVRTPGSTVFGAAGGTDVFQMMLDAAVALETPVSTDADRLTMKNALADATNRLDSSLDQVLTARTAMGAGLQELDGWTATLELEAVQQDRRLSELRDLDYAQAATELSQQQTALEAAQSVFARVSQLSLFDMLR